jgi:hypothetical protein
MFSGFGCRNGRADGVAANVVLRDGASAAAFMAGGVAAASRSQ